MNTNSIINRLFESIRHWFMYGHCSLVCDWVYDELTEEEYNDLMELINSKEQE